MAAALSPNAGLPAGAGRKRAAGVLFTTPDGDALFIKRQGADYAGHWSIPAGSVENGETFHDAAEREAHEEVAFRDLPSFRFLRQTSDEDGLDFATFRHNLDERFDPELNDESSEYVWAPLNDPPSPLHPGLASLLAEFFAEEAEEPAHKSGVAQELENEFARGAQDEGLRIVFDESVREFDDVGRMRVKVANISKEQIRPYKGSEIPGSEELGLDPDKIYNMFCPGEELEKAAPTFNGVQLLRKHVPVDSENHRMWDIVGTTGSEAYYEAPYLKNSIFVWTDKAIDLIESNKQRELSCGYHYTPEMISGVFNGEQFDGIMRDIKGNHITIVEEGRAGHDVLIGDSVEDYEWSIIEKCIFGLSIK
jgi:8-oxo-dGTP pyrophosphatase MutT (NUDIX family)